MQKLRRRPAPILVAAGALAAMVAVSGLLLFGAGGSSADPLRIEVFAKQYSWSFGYPSEGNVFSEREFHVPTGRPVEFEMHSEDVIHAFWVPEWKVKVDTVPGDIAEVEVTPETGTYQLICSEGCGILHSEMRAKIVVEEPAQFQRWLDSLGPVPPSLRKQARLDREARAIRESLDDGESS